MKSNKDLIYVIGHKNPDTDSIASAIAYAELKKELGYKTVSGRLGNVNDETNYLLKRFGFKLPTLLKDARASLSEIEIDNPAYIKENCTIFEAMKIMEKEEKLSLGVVGENQKIIGIVTKSDLSNVAIGDTESTVKLLQSASVDNLAKSINGEIIYEPKNFDFNGKVSLLAIAATGLRHYELTNSLAVIGDDVKAQIDAIEKGAAGLVLVWTKNINNKVLNKAKANQCAIIKSSIGAMNTSRFLLFSAPVSEIMTRNPIYFNEHDFVKDVGKEMLKTRFRSYPVLDDNNYIKGFISRYHVLNRRNKKFILVDHNETSQSIEGIEEAEILEIIDHHRIGDIDTSNPILFRNEIIGSTASIITKMYREHNIKIQKNVAGLLLGAVISDTLNFRSPTTTSEDIELAYDLANIAELDMIQFASDLFKVTSSIKNKAYKDIINQDIKTFNINEKKIMVSQVIVYDFEELNEIIKNFFTTLESFTKENNLDLLVVAFTSIVDNGSILIGSGKLQEALDIAFPPKDEESINFYSDVVSRKKQIIPKLSKGIQQLID